MTRRQAQTLAFIKDYIASHGGVSPSYREIGNCLGLTSLNGVHRIIHALSDRGHISVVPGIKRSIHVFCAGDDLHLTLARDIDRALDRYARKTGTNKATAAAELLRQSLGVAA